MRRSAGFIQGPTHWIHASVAFLVRFCFFILLIMDLSNRGTLRVICTITVPYVLYVRLRYRTCLALRLSTIFRYSLNSAVPYLLHRRLRYLCNSVYDYVLAHVTLYGGYRYITGTNFGTH